MKGVLDGTVPSKEVSEIGINAATGEVVEKVLEKHSNVTEAMERDAELAEIKNKAILKEGED